MPRICLGVLALGIAAWAAPQLEDARTYFERGVGLFETHDDSGESLDQAEVEFHRAVALDPKLAPAVAYLGFIAAEHQKPQQAEEAYRQALAIDGRCAEARVGLARLDLQKGKRAEALTSLRQAVTDQPHHRLALRELGYTLTN